MGIEVATALLNKILSNTTNNLVSLDLYGNKLLAPIENLIVKFVE